MFKKWNCQSRNGSVCSRNRNIYSRSGNFSQEIKMSVQEVEMSAKKWKCLFKKWKCQSRNRNVCSRNGNVYSRSAQCFIIERNLSLQGHRTKVSGNSQRNILQYLDNNHALLRVHA